LKLLTLQRANLGDVPFDDEFTQRHCFLLVTVICSRAGPILDRVTKCVLCPALPWLRSP
jgi:hypothetical protein